MKGFCSQKTMERRITLHLLHKFCSGKANVFTMAPELIPSTPHCCPCSIDLQDQTQNPSSLRFSTYHLCPGDGNWGSAKLNNVTSLSLRRNQGQMYLFPHDRDRLSLKVSKLGHFETKAGKSNQGLMQIKEEKGHFKRRGV